MCGEKRKMEIRKLKLVGGVVAGLSDFLLAGIKLGSLHCASPRVRRSEREEKSWARFGRDDSFCFWRTDEFGQGSTRNEMLLQFATQ